MTYGDRRIGKTVAPYIRREDAAGVRIDSGPYLGKVKSNLDTARQGRLQVWIPDLSSGEEDNPSNWRTVQYASPFFGATAQNDGDKENTFKHVRHTYGMWFTPPDVDNFVLCVFVAGDPMRGYYFACIPNQLGQYMVPGLSRSKNFEDNSTDPIVQGIKKDKELGLPVVEFNENAVTDFSTFIKEKKPLHDTQVKVLVEQGLDRDPKRGVFTSSSQRESPSKVFGISTPGQPLEKKKGGTELKDLKVFGRKGGHTFVMDDGDFEEKNKLIRLRTSGGHQIVMNDTDEIFYISNTDGTAWVELTKGGNVNIFSSGNVSMRAKESIYFHADKNFSVHCDEKMTIFAKKELKIESETITSKTKKETTMYASEFRVGAESAINLYSKGTGSFTVEGDLTLHGNLIKLNSGKGPTVEKPEPIKWYKMPEAKKTGVGQWEPEDDKLKSTVKIAPTHEPWDRKPGKPSAEDSSASSAAESSSDNGQQSNSSGGGSSEPQTLNAGQQGVNVDKDGNPVVSGSSGSSGAGPSSALKESVKNPVDKSYMYRNDNVGPSSGVGPLNQTEIKALMTQLGHSESGNDYAATERQNGNYLGKYQVGADVLKDQGYIKEDAWKEYGNRAVQYPSSWTGKNGVTSKESFLNSPSAQESVMYNNLTSNYNAMVQSGAIKSSDNTSTVAGMLATSHLLGASGAAKWRSTGVGADANKTTGATYFNQGRYAVDVLAKPA